MSGRKGAAILLCAVVVFAAVSLSGGVGVGGSAAATNAEFQVQNADLTEETIVEGESVTVTATVDNVGTETGTFTAELETEADGVISTRDIEIGPGKTETVDFTEPFETAGTYELSVSGEPAGTLEVTEPASAEFDVTEAKLSESEISAGDAVTVTATVANTGDADGTYTADLVINGSVEESKSVDVNAGETATVKFTPSFETTGNYTISVSDESAGTLEVTEPASAEFDVTAVTLSESEIIAGDTVTVTAEIANTGDADGTYAAELVINTAVEESKSVDVTAGETVTVTYTPSFESAGDYTVGVGDGSTKELTVVEPEPANISVTTAELSETTVDPGESVTVTATVVNNGGTAGEFTADLQVDGATRDTRTLTLDAGKQRTIEFAPSFEEAGTYKIAVSGVSAGSLTVSEPAAFEVSNTQLADDTILTGDDAVVSAEIRNVGDAEGTFTAEFRVTGQDGTTQTVDTQSVTLTGGESQPVELRGVIEQPGEYDVQVNQAGAGTLTVESPADLAVTGTTLEEDVVSVDDEVTVGATIENTGDREGSLSVTVAADGATKTTEEVAVAPGESTQGQLTYTATTAGEYEITVNGVNAGTLTVVRPATFSTTNAAVEPDTVLAGESAEVTATIVNIGTESGTHTATLVADGESVDTQKIEIGPGGSETVVFSPAFETAAEYSIAVNDESAGTLSVLEPANVSIRETTLSAEEIIAGESATVTVDLANDGDVEGEFTTQLQDGNDTLETDTQTVGPDTSETIRFNQTFETTGEYDLTVNDDPVGTLAVLEPADVLLGETSLAAESVEVGESIELTIELVNDGEATGQRDVDIGLGDGTTIQRSPDVPEGGTTLTITHAYNATGEYAVVVDDTTVGNVSVVDPQDNAGTGGGGGSSGSSGSSGSAGSSDPSGSTESDDNGPTVVRSESNEAVTVRVEGATGERSEIPADLAGPSESQPAVSLTSLMIDPAGDRDAFEATIGRPTAEPDGRDPVPHGTALGYVDLNSTLDAANTNAATLQFSLDQGAIPNGLGPEDVAVLRYADGEWTTANVTHTIESGTHTVTLPHAAPVAIVALEPGRVDIVESTVPADRVREGYETILRATVENPGDRPATRTLTVTMHDEPVAEQEVSLEPGANATVQIEFEPRESGTVFLEGDEADSIALFGDSGNETPSTDSETDDGVPGFGVGTVVLALLVTALAVRIRQ